jgi:hypothetical protein
MITLKHLIAGRIPTNLGPSAESWTRPVMIFILIVVVAGVVALWNRSRYHPYHGGNAPRGGRQTGFLD